MKETWNYQVGALLYCPANNQSLAKNIIWREILLMPVPGRYNQ